MAPFAMEDLPHSFARLDRMFRAIDPKRRLPASQADSFGFLPQHVDLLARHRCAIRFEHAGILICNLLSAP